MLYLYVNSNETRSQSNLSRFERYWKFDVWIFIKLWCHQFNKHKVTDTGAQLGEEREEASLALFWKSKKEKKLQNSSLQGIFFLAFLMKCSSKCPNSTKPPLPWKSSGCASLRQINSTDCRIYWNYLGSAF